MHEYIVIIAEEGKVVEKKIEKNDPETLLKQYAKNALDKWRPLESDFTIIKSSIDISYQIPLSPSLYERVVGQNLALRKEGREAIVTIPVYTISYNNKWEGDRYMDKGLVVIAPYLDESEAEQLVKYAIEATSAEGEVSIVGEEPSISLTQESLKRLEEGLIEIEEEVKEKKTRKKRKRKKK